jgi:hypothetical protein
MQKHNYQNARITVKKKMKGREKIWPGTDGT